MALNSLGFIFYFLPAVLAGSLLLGFSRTLGNIWLFVVSLLFYAWGDPFYVLFLLGAIVVNYILGRIIEKSRDQDAAQLIMILGVFVNIGSLFVLNYLPSIIAAVNEYAGAPILELHTLPVPPGLPFFVLRAISYIVDAHRRDTSASQSLLQTGLYFAFFPLVLAGPIVTYDGFADQLASRRSSWTLFSEGCGLFVVGLAKKVVIADSLGGIANHVFNLNMTGNVWFDVPAMLSWLGAIAFALQFYYDFSGYSDMAVGLSRMFGLSVPDNFRYPYAAVSVSGFWGRWHISLYAWFTRYLDSALHNLFSASRKGTRVSRKSAFQTRIQLVFWLIVGLWHGAGAAFLFMGFWFFVASFIDHMAKSTEHRIPRLARHAFLLFVVLCAWIFFRAGSFSYALNYLANMFGVNGNGFHSDLALVMLRENWVIFLLAIVFSTPLAERFLLADGRGGGIRVVAGILYPVVLLFLFAVSIVYLVNVGPLPFIFGN